MFLSKISDFIRSNTIDCSVVIVAAGSSRRFGSDKLAARMAGAPVLAYSVAMFQRCDYVKEIVIVAQEDTLMQVARLCDEQGFYKVSKIIIGGETRVESALAGVSECREGAGLIAIHDGARPLVTLDVINAAIERAATHRAAVPAVPSRDTVKLAEDGAVFQTPDRESAFCVQTPQVFEPVIIKGALTNALNKELRIFDDATAVEALGFTVYLSAGSEENIKITTPLDLQIAEVILARRKKAAAIGGDEL